MAITEQSRHQLFNKLEEVLGMEDAGTLFNLLPPVGWGEVATKRDIDELRVGTKRDIDGLKVATKQDLDLMETRLDSRFRDELTSKLRGQFFAIAALFIGVLGLLLAAGRF